MVDPENTHYEEIPLTNTHEGDRLQGLHYIRPEDMPDAYMMELSSPAPDPGEPTTSTESGGSAATRHDPAYDDWRENIPTPEETEGAKAGLLKAREALAKARAKTDSGANPESEQEAGAESAA